MIQVSITVDDRSECGFELLGQLQGQTSLSRILQGIANILQMRARPAAHGKITGDHPRSELFEHGAAGKATADRLEKGIEIKPAASRQRNALAYGANRHADDDLIGELGDLPRAGWAEIGRPAERLKHRKHPVENLPIATHHDRKPAGFGAGGPARDWSVELRDAMLG